jgi:hypothetical protein
MATNYTISYTIPNGWVQGEPLRIDTRWERVLLSRAHPRLDHTDNEGELVAVAFLEFENWADAGRFMKWWFGP